MAETRKTLIPWLWVQHPSNPMVQIRRILGMLWHLCSSQRVRLCAMSMNTNRKRPVVRSRRALAPTLTGRQSRVSAFSNPQDEDAKANSELARRERELDSLFDEAS